MEKKGRAGGVGGGEEKRGWVGGGGEEMEIRGRA